MKKSSIALAFLLVAVVMFSAGQVSGQVHMKLTDYRVAAAQDFGDQLETRSDDPFRPLAEERTKSAEDKDAIDEIDNLDLDLDEPETQSDEPSHPLAEEMSKSTEDMNEKDEVDTPDLDSDDEPESRSDEPFDPFAEERSKSTEDMDESDEIDDLDLGLDDEPDLGDDDESKDDLGLDEEPDLGDDADSEEDSDEEDEELDLERSKNESSPPPISIEEFLRPISSLSKNGKTQLSPERGGINFPPTLTPPAMLESPRNTWAVSNVQWQKPMGYHRQLYFEDIPLERHGIQAGRWKQNIISGAKFLGDGIKLPVRRLQQPRWQVYQRSVDRFGDPNLFGQ